MTSIRRIITFRNKDLSFVRLLWCRYREKKGENTDMITTKCVNAKIIGALAKCGHGDKVLIGSGNFPLDTQSNPEAEKVYVNLSGGVPTATQVLEAVLGMVHAEAAAVICPPQIKETPEVFADFRRCLGDVELTRCGRDEFYELCRESGVRLAIESADLRPFSNILLTVGVVREA